MPLTLEQIQERAKPWTTPIDPQTPAGKSVRSDPAYEAVLAEVGKLESLSGAAPDWNAVGENAGKLLQSSTKDLLLACYLSSAWHVLKGSDGLVHGLGVLTSLMEQYWPVMFPEVNRIRGRVNALSWFIQRTTNLLAAGGGAQALKREDVETLEAAATLFAQTVRTKFEANAPSLTPLLQAIERMKIDLPQPQPTAVAATTTPVTETPAAATGPAPASSSPSSPSAGAFTAPTIGSADGITAEGMTDFLRQVGTALVTASTTLRRTNPADASAVRIGRLGLWLHLNQPPPRNATGRTTVPPLPANLRSRMEQLATHGKWAELLEESEGALAQFRFCLDLQRFSAQALRGLGAAYNAAREALVLAVADVLRRFPTLVELQFSDGSSFADATTRTWVAEELTAGAASASRNDAARPSRADDAKTAEVSAKARELLNAGNAPEAIAFLQSQAVSAPTSREKFVLRLALAKVCSDAGQPAVARGLYAALEKECTARGLDEWEPNLAVECLEGLLGTARSLSKSNGMLPAELAPQYHRLCQLAPDVALRFGG